MRSIIDLRNSGLRLSLADRTPKVMALVCAKRNWKRAWSIAAKRWLAAAIRPSSEAISPLMLSLTNSPSPAPKMVSSPPASAWTARNDQN